MVIFSDSTSKVKANLLIIHVVFVAPVQKYLTVKTKTKKEIMFTVSWK